MNPQKQIPVNILNEIKLGNKIEAIKMLREQLGISLIEAKDLVEKVSSSDIESGGNKINQSTNSVSERALNFLRQGKKIDAIKVVREETGLGLKDSKELIEKVIEENSEVKELFSAHSKEGLRTFIFVILAVILIYFLLKLIG